LIDGGALNNLPTDVALRMGADVVIAVDLGMNVSQETPFDSVLGVMNRTLSVMMRVNSDTNAERADVLIAPDVSAFGFAAFDRSDELVDVGYESGAALAEPLAGYVVDEIAWRCHLAARAERRQIFQAVPQFIDIDRTIDPDGRAVVAVLDHHLGQELDPDHLADHLTRVVGWGRYDVAGYEQRSRGGSHGCRYRRPRQDLRPSVHAADSRPAGQPVWRGSDRVRRTVHLL